MSFRYMLLLSAGLVATGARADYSAVTHATENSAYKVVQITEADFNADDSGKVFKDFAVNESGEVVPQYYRYELNTGKEYDRVVTFEESASGDGQSEVEGETLKVNPGMGLRNPEGITANLVPGVGYKNNTFEYEYTGNGEANVIVRGGVFFNAVVIGTKDADGNFTGTAIDADFIGNSMSAKSEYADAVHIDGTVIANKGQIGLVKGDFVENKAIGNNVDGGVVYNNSGSYIKGFEGDFVGNASKATNTHGGAIFNLGMIEDISGNFIANTIDADTQANGGAIQNNDDAASIGTISGSFIGNKAVSNLEAWGGAIDNASGTIGNITGEYNNNLAEAHGTDAMAVGGAISNQGTIENISGTFIANRAVADDIAAGGAIYHDGSSSKEDALKIVNSNFYNNSVTADGDALGGAIYGNYVQISADGKNSEFRGNTANGENNAVYIEGDWRSNGALILSGNNSGKVIFDDNVSGAQYDIDILGDGTGEVVFNSRVDNANNLTVGNEAVMHLGTAADVNVTNYSAADNATLKLDVAVDTANNKVDNGIIRVGGDIQGETTVIVNSLNEDVLENPDNAVAMFVESANDNPDTYSAFKVGRVIGSPYMWKSVKNYYNEEGDTVSNWYLALKDNVNADDGNSGDDGNDGNDGDNDKEYAPEVGAYVAMQTAAVEQNRGITHKISDGLRANRNRGCCDRKFAPRREAWVNADYSYAEIDAPSEMDANIKGVTAGFDVAADARNRVGLFGAYHQGDYDLSGKGDFRSSLGSKMDIDSYLGGLYYSYGGRNWTALATVFAGQQDINTKTDDHLATADTSAMQYGAGLEVARKFYLPYAWIIEPSLGLYYTALDMDGFTDNVGKKVEFDVMHYMEAELGLRFEHLFCRGGWTSKVYMKPSVIQTFASGNRTRITGLKQADTYENQTLGRMEIGAKFGLTPALSAYTSANYTFGSEYQAYGVDAGLMYAW